jgi:hypothetical protein
MVKPDQRFDYHRYRDLLAEAVDDTKRRALIDLLIEERAKDRLQALRASDQKATTAASVARVLGKGPDLARAPISVNPAEASTPAIEDDLDVFYFPAAPTH